MVSCSFSDRANTNYRLLFFLSTPKQGFPVSPAHRNFFYLLLLGRPSRCVHLTHIHPIIEGTCWSTDSFVWYWLNVRTKLSRCGEAGEGCKYPFLESVNPNIRKATVWQRCAQIQIRPTLLGLTCHPQTENRLESTEKCCNRAQLDLCLTFMFSPKTFYPNFLRRFQTFEVLLSEVRRPFECSHTYPRPIYVRRLPNIPPVHKAFLSIHSTSRTRCATHHHWASTLKERMPCLLSRKVKVVSITLGRVSDESRV